MKLAGLTAIVLLAATGLASAAGTGGCDAFKFPVATELQWMRAPETDAAASGASLPAPPAKAITLTLAPTPSVTFAVQPAKTKGKPEETFAALVNFAGTASPGLHQVSLSGSGWIEVIQNGKALPAVAYSGISDCESLHKSVRFDLAAGPFSVQLSDVSVASIKITIRKAD